MAKESYHYTEAEEAEFDRLVESGRVTPDMARAQLGIKAVHSIKKPTTYTVPSDSPGEIYRNTSPDPTPESAANAYQFARDNFEASLAKKVANQEITAIEAMARLRKYDDSHPAQ